MLEPLKPVATTGANSPKPAQSAPAQSAPAQTELLISNDILQRVNGEMCFSLQFGEKSLLISESKCSQLIPEFKKMNSEQKETFLLQAAIFGANPFSIPAEIYPMPFQSGGVTTYAPAISAKKYIEKGMENPTFDGMKSGVVVEREDGTFDFRRGQIFGKKESLVGGWCEIYIKGMREPIFRSVNLDEFIQRKGDGTPNSFWKSKPALMIEKVAQKQAMEIAIKMPRTYVAEELQIIEDADHQDISQQKVIASNAEFFRE